MDATVLLAASFSGAGADGRGFAEARQFQQRRWDTGANQLLASVVGAVEAEFDVVAGGALVVTVAFDGDDDSVEVPGEIEEENRIAIEILDGVATEDTLVEGEVDLFESGGALSESRWRFGWIDCGRVKDDLGAEAEAEEERHQHQSVADAKQAARPRDIAPYFLGLANEASEGVLGCVDVFLGLIVESSLGVYGADNRLAVAVVDGT